MVKAGLRRPWKLVREQFEEFGKDFTCAVLGHRFEERTELQGITHKPMCRCQRPGCKVIRNYSAAVLAKRMEDGDYDGGPLDQVVVP